MPLQAVEPKRLYRQIADQIAGLIAKGEFPNGSRLPAERELASKLGVSRASLREAIISLEIAGLVEVRVGTGIFVKARTGSGSDAHDAGPGPFELLNARKLIEGEIAALAAKRATAPDIDGLRAPDVDFWSVWIGRASRNRRPVRDGPCWTYAGICSETTLGCWHAIAIVTTAPVHRAGCKSATSRPGSTTFKCCGLMPPGASAESSWSICWRGPVRSS